MNDTQGLIGGFLIDAGHAWEEVKNDFEKIYPCLNPNGWVGFFHDTLMCSGSRAYNIDLRTIFSSPEYDICDFQHGYGEHVCGVTMVVKRTFHLPHNQNRTLQDCGSPYSQEEIYKKERDFYESEVKRHQKS